MVTRRIFISIILLLSLSLISAHGPVFGIQPGTPSSLPGFIQPESGCNWTGVGGQVFDSLGSPFAGLVVVIAGILDGQSLLKYAFSGSSLQIGPGGYEITLADHLIPAQQASLAMQLQDITGQILSGVVGIQLSSDCSHNMVLVNFIQLKFDNYFPIIKK